MKCLCGFEEKADGGRFDVIDVSEPVKTSSVLRCVNMGYSRAHFLGDVKTLYVCPRCGTLRVKDLLNNEEQEASHESN